MSTIIGVLPAFTLPLQWSRNLILVNTSTRLQLVYAEFLHWPANI